MAKPRVRLGELLVEAGIVTSEQLDEVLVVQKRDGRRLGTLVVESGLVTETQVTQILSQQLSVPWVSLHHIEFSRTLLDLVPREVAEKYCLVPIFVRRVRGYGNTLYIAMDDPSDERAQGEVAEFSGLPVRAMIAPPSDIRSAIRVYYGASEPAPKASQPPLPPDAAEAAPADTLGATAEAEPALAAPIPGGEVAAEPVDSGVSEAPARVVEAEENAAIPTVEDTPPVPPEPAAAGAFAASEPDSGPQIEAHEIELPRARRGKGRKMITLTLLDGTQINLPAHGERAAGAAPAADSSLTAGDLVLALKAVAHGADAKEILGESPRWESMFAALLSLLLKKHLIADWEFVDEYKKG
jgi:type IV pilus assembly protein PilB